MARYGIDYYGSSYYGPGTGVKFDASPFVAKPYGYGSMYLSWVNPSGDWARIRIVRNKYGYPVDAWDGLVVVDEYNGNVNNFIIESNNLEQGSYYYYSIFVYETVQYSWVRAANAIGVSVKKFGNGDRMYEYMPEIYKIAEPYSASSKLDNPDLYRFLSLFGFELDYIQTITELLISKYDTEKLNGFFVEVLMNQFGVSYEPEIGLQQNRIMLRNGVLTNKERGSRAGLLEFLKSFTGYAVSSLVVGHNMMLDYNDSSFEESIGHWISSDSTATASALRVFSIKSVSLTSNVATVVIGAHKYNVGDSVYISGLPYPLFNSLTPYAITAVDQTQSISFSLTASDLTSRTGYNESTGEYGKVTPNPIPWVEATAPLLFPNKATGVMSVANVSSSTQTISLFAGDDNPVIKGIPVTTSTVYTFSIYAAKGSTARNVTAKIKWYDRFGTYLSTSSGSAVSDNTTAFSTSYRPFVTDTAPSTAAYACPGFSIASVGNAASNERHYFDAAQFEEAASATDFDEARQLHITLRATRINELLNPTFAAPLTPWAVSGATYTSISSLIEPTGETFTISSGSITSNVATISTTTAHTLKVGSNVYISGVTGANAADYNGLRTVTNVSLYSFDYSVTASDSSITDGYVWKAGDAVKLTATGTSPTVESWDGSTTSQQMAIYYPDTSYTFSIYVKAITGSGDTVKASISWYDNLNALISTSDGDELQTTSDWIRPYVTATAPTTASYATVKLTWNTTVTNEIAVDQAVFENSAFLLEYFDGSTGPSATTSFIWEGGIGGDNTSRSHYYKNKSAVQYRLYSAIQSYLPLGTTYAIYLAQPGT